MFGWPTGVGALLARREALARLERRWCSGGTIVAAFVQREWYQSAPGAAHFEDGTVNFLRLPAVEIGLRLLERLGIETIHARVHFADVERFAAFASEFVDLAEVPGDLPPRTGC